MNVCGHESWNFFLADWWICFCCFKSLCMFVISCGKRNHVHALPEVILNEVVKTFKKGSNLCKRPNTIWMCFIPGAVVAVELQQLLSYSDGLFSSACPTTPAMLGEACILTSKFWNLRVKQELATWLELAYKEWSFNFEYKEWLELQCI
jgi:hypothetical protein